MEQTIAPTVPAAGLSAVTIPALGFIAQSAVISTGAYSVAVQGVQGDQPIPPGVSGMVIEMSTPSQAPAITVTAPPAGTSPITPQGLPSVVFSDQPLTPVPGLLSTPQNMANIAFAQTGQIIINCGLARGLAFALWWLPATGNQPSVTISGQAAPGGTPRGFPIVYVAEQLVPAPVASGWNGYFFFAVGQGTVQAIPFALPAISGGAPAIQGYLGQNLPIMPQIIIQDGSSPANGPMNVAGCLFF